VVAGAARPPKGSIAAGRSIEGCEKPVNVTVTRCSAGEPVATPFGNR
jgi:hypothetical protein